MLDVYHGVIAEPLGQTGSQQTTTPKWSPLSVICIESPALNAKLPQSEPASLMKDWVPMMIPLLGQGSVGSCSSTS